MICANHKDQYCTACHKPVCLDADMPCECALWCVECEQDNCEHYTAPGVYTSGLS
jgi:hypothetical protein